jgi:tRNA threonylcarbamoyladenosine biosynthesis protein TsaE
MPVIQRSSTQLPSELDFISHSPAQTIRIGQRLGELLHQGDVVLLSGDFGTGKTHLIKGIAQGLGSNDLVTSPSFVLVNEYHAQRQSVSFPIYHADLYRLDQPAEVQGIGIDDLMQGHGVTLIEWAEHGGGYLPHEHLAIHLRHLSETKRVLRFVPHGQHYLDLMLTLKRTSFAA